MHCWSVKTVAWDRIALRAFDSQASARTDHPCTVQIRGLCDAEGAAASALRNPTVSSFRRRTIACETRDRERAERAARRKLDARQCACGPRAPCTGQGTLLQMLGRDAANGVSIHQGVFVAV